MIEHGRPILCGRTQSSSLAEQGGVSIDQVDHTHLLMEGRMGWVCASIATEWCALYDQGLRCGCVILGSCTDTVVLLWKEMAKMGDEGIHSVPISVGDGDAVCIR